MSLTQRLATKVKAHMVNLQKAYNNQMAAADARARASMAKTKTKADREKVKAKLAQEQLAIKRELYEAQAATKKAKVSLEKARKEAGDLTMGERLEQTLKATYRGLRGTKPPKRTKRTTARKRAKPRKR